MKQAIMTPPGKIQLRDIAAPTPGPGEVLLRIQRIGVCGSDVHVYHGKHPYTKYPVVQGHEYSASVEAVGGGVTGLALGTKVTSMPQIVCGECAPCLRGDYHICDKLKVEGFQAPGCAQELWVTDGGQDHPAARPLQLRAGRAGGAGLGRRACRLARRQPRGRRRAEPRRPPRAVLGAGPIGNLVAQVARSEGAQVLITDLSAYRLEVARQCGLTGTSNANAETLAEAAERIFGKAGFDVVFECVGVEPTITAAVETIQKGGTLVIVGVFGEKPRIDMGLVQDRELNIRGTLMYRGRITNAR